MERNEVKNERCKMKGIKSILFFAVACFLMASCVTSRKVNYMQEPDKYIPSYADTLDYEEYQLRIGDRLYVYVYSLNEEVMRMFNPYRSGGGQMGAGGMGMNNELYTYLVDDDGNIDFPTVGKINVLGKNTREVKFLLEEHLGTLLQEIPGFSTISVQVNIVNRTFSVVGIQSGQYNIIKEKMNIFEALAMIGDIHDFNSHHEIKLVREKNGVTTIKTFDIRSKDIVNSEFYYIEPNDIIYIRHMKGYSFGINHAMTAMAVTASFISYGAFIYSIVQTGINHVQKHYGNQTSGEGGSK